MANTPTIQALSAAFLAAIARHDIAEAEVIPAQLRALAVREPVGALWADYAQGILANERDYNWAEAERIFINLLLNPPEPPLHGRVLLALARTYDLQGRWTEAIQTCESSLPLFAALDQPVDQAKAWKQMAISYYGGFTQGDFGAEVLSQAVTYGHSALTALGPLTNDDDLVSLKGTIWNILGLVQVSLGRWDEALACYQQDLAICQTLDDRYGQGLTYGNLGEVYQKQGHWLEALAAYRQALTIIREAGNRYEEIEALANLSFLYQEMGETETALDHYRQTIQLIEGLRAGVSAEAAQAGFFATVVDTYANMALLCLTANRPEQAFNTIEQSRSRAFLDSLAARSPQLAERVQQQEQGKAATITLAEVQAALPPDTLLLEYFTTGLVEARAGHAVDPQAQRHRFPPARTLLFAISRNTLSVYDIGLSPNDLRPQQLNSVAERHFLQPQIRRTLYNRLIAPIEPLLPGVCRLYLIPHGPLHYLPFQALLSSDNQTLLHENGPQLVFAPSATLLFRYGQIEPNQLPASCLAIGYNGRAETSLRFAEEEARTIVQLTGGQALVGPALKKSELYRQAEHYRLLHFSCHGEFDPDIPLASALHLAPGETLTALDVLDHLHLQCDLVTLSACESGLSRVRRGDELVGLTRAFMYAGAPALVSTLWRVDERSTRILMEKFYQEVQNGANFAEALKRAQLYVKNLTRREVLAMLARPTAPSGETAISAKPSDELRSFLPQTGVAWQQTRAYLKGVAGQGEPNEVAWPSEADEDQIFADPFYWAPFILVM